ncbi:MAG TPA: hypothetical protein VND98_10470 [Solirubrobacterales bacterium]|nr:hypothetical protein [Solirubrobacterales bacterium]
MSEDMRILMVGLSGSGKTTYLAALYELVRAEPPLPGALRLVEEPAQRDYFHRIAQNWLKLERMLHTQPGDPRTASLQLMTADQRSFQLDIPDISGEDFNHAWEGDPWPDAVKEVAADADAVLIFARRDEVKRPLFLPPDDAEPPPEGKEKWSAEDAPTQTKLADLLESLDAMVTGALPMALIASAWDMGGDEEEIRPDQWLKLRLPLLWQMLESRKEARPYRVYGVSAQGGDVENEKERARLAEIEPAYLRVDVRSGEESSSDISAPISWLFEQLQ